MITRPRLGAYFVALLGIGWLLAMALTMAYTFILAMQQGGETTVHINGFHESYWEPPLIILTLLMGVHALVYVIRHCKP